MFHPFSMHLQGFTRFPRFTPANLTEQFALQDEAELLHP